MTGAGPAWRQALRYATEAGVPARSLRVAAVIGTLLNLINQGDALWGEARIAWPKLLLTYLVPYGVATYGAVSIRMQMARTRRAG
ncbi:MAG: nitrate/nitrite transporter NrtS [Acetobacteraceae bacterium]|nr:nitrate/nitrite transporter NrtS [Acetobacteraceae bacterium]